MDSRLEKVETKLDKMETRLEKVETKLDKVETKLETLSKKFRDYEPLFHKAGDTYELVVRNEFKHMKGAEFARYRKIVSKLLFL